MLDLFWEVPQIRAAFERGTEQGPTFDKPSRIVCIYIYIYIEIYVRQYDATNKYIYIYAHDLAKGSPNATLVHASDLTTRCAIPRPKSSLND